MRAARCAHVSLGTPGRIKRIQSVKVQLSHRQRAITFSRAPMIWDREKGPAICMLSHLGIYAYRRDFLLGYNSCLKHGDNRKSSNYARSKPASLLPVMSYIMQPRADNPADYDGFLQRLRSHAVLPASRSNYAHRRPKSKRTGPTRHIFVTGGVVSVWEKELPRPPLVAFDQYGLFCPHSKVDPYLNVDPGTMNPFRHGEVFVTEDGAETDLDLGHYERSLGSPVLAINLYLRSNHQNVINNERYRYNSGTARLSHILPIRGQFGH